jgi:hypothetical protein
LLPKIIGVKEELRIAPPLRCAIVMDREQMFSQPFDLSCFPHWRNARYEIPRVFRSAWRNKAWGTCTLDNT